VEFLSGLLLKSPWVIGRRSSQDAALHPHKNSSASGPQITDNCCRLSTARIHIFVAMPSKPCTIFDKLPSMLMMSTQAKKTSRLRWCQNTLNHGTNRLNDGWCARLTLR
jgi:hypothetical protein